MFVILVILVIIVILVNSVRLLVRYYFVEFIISRTYNRSSLNWPVCFEFMTKFEFVLVELEIATPFPNLTLFNLTLSILTYKLT
jgi:hypothetical protein